VEHRRSNHPLRIRDARELHRRGGGKRHGVGEGDEDQSEGDETPAVIADVVEFEVVGRQVELRGRSEPFVKVSPVLVQFPRFNARGGLRCMWEGLKGGVWCATYSRRPLRGRIHGTRHADRTKKLFRTHMRGRPGSSIC
jgi:hypothetical protein